MWWGSPHLLFRHRFTLGQFLAWWLVFKQLKQSPWSHAIFLLSCRCLDLKTGQKATGCLCLQMTHFLSPDGAFFSCSLFAGWDWSCFESDKSRLLVRASGEVSVIVARGFHLRLGFDLGILCFWLHSSHMKSSRGLNSVSTRLRSHSSNSTRVDLLPRPSICSYHLTLRFMGSLIVALLRIPKLTFQCLNCGWVAMACHTQTLHCFVSFPIKILE